MLDSHGLHKAKINQMHVSHFMAKISWVSMVENCFISLFYHFTYEDETPRNSR